MGVTGMRPETNLAIELKQKAGDVKKGSFVVVIRLCRDERAKGARSGSEGTDP